MGKYIWRAGIFASIFATVLCFQNCAKKTSSFTYDETLDTTKGKYGYGAGGGGYNCVPGKRLGIWLDPDDSGTFKDENKLGIVVSYVGAKDAAANYNYYSASAHPLVGPTPIGFKMNVFFYEGPDGLALNIFSNIDAGGSEENQVDVDIQTTGNGGLDSVLLSDDGPEFKHVSTGNGAKNYQGRFHYWSNTDGGVLGPFKGDRYKIRVKMLASGDIQDARFYSANGYSFNLKDSVNQVSSFLIAYEEYEDCTETP